MNTPYVKQYNEKGEVTNPITKENPYLHHSPSTRSQKRRLKYIIVTNMATGAYVGEIKRGGNNRKVAASTLRRKPNMKKRNIH